MKKKTVDSSVHKWLRKEYSELKESTGSKRGGQEENLPPGSPGLVRKNQTQEEETHGSCEHQGRGLAQVESRAPLLLTVEKLLNLSLVSLPSFAKWKE